MGFIFFVLATAALLIRPGEQFPELRGARIYEALILLCAVFSISEVLQQFTLRALEVRPINLCLLGLLVAVVLSHVTQGNSKLAVDDGFEFFKVVVYYVLLVANITTALRLRIFITSIGLFAVLFVSLAVLQYHDVMKLPEPEPEELAAAAAENPKAYENLKAAFVTDVEYDPISGQMVEFKRLRGTGTFRDPNDMCLLLSMGIFIALFGLTDHSQSVFRWAWVGPLLFFFFALALTQSRGGFVSLLAGCMILLGARYGWRWMLLGLPLVPVIIVLVGGRMTSFSAVEGTGQTRIQIWSDGLQELRSAPVFGIGFNELGTAIGKAAHNSFLSAYAELGVFGGTFFFAAFFFAFVMMWRLLKSREALRDPCLRRLVPFLLAMLTSYAVAILALSRVGDVPTYLVLGLVTASLQVATMDTPVPAVRLDLPLVQRMALASVAFLASSYLLVRVLLRA
jgi:O-Antigen ligase